MEPVAGIRYSPRGTGPRENTTAKTDLGQFDNREYSMEVIYSGSDQDYDFKDDESHQVQTGEAGRFNVVLRDRAGRS